MIEFRVVPHLPLHRGSVRARARVWLVTVIGFRTRPLDGRFPLTYVDATLIGIRSHINQNIPGPEEKKHFYIRSPTTFRRPSCRDP